MISRVESGCVAVCGTVIWRYYDQTVANLAKTLVSGRRYADARFDSLRSALRTRLRRIEIIDEEHGELALSLGLQFAARGEFEAAAEEVVRGPGDVHLAYGAG